MLFLWKECTMEGGSFILALPPSFIFFCLTWFWFTYENVPIRDPRRLFCKLLNVLGLTWPNWPLSPFFHHLAEKPRPKTNTIKPSEQLQPHPQPCTSKHCTNYSESPVNSLPLLNNGPFGGTQGYLQRFDYKTKTFGITIICHTIMDDCIWQNVN